MERRAASGGRRLADVVATTILCMVAIAVALVLVFSALVWGAGTGIANSWGLVLGIFGPMVTTVLGILAAIVQLSRHRLGFVVPLVTIAVTCAVWWIAGLVAV